MNLFVSRYRLNRVFCKIHTTLFKLFLLGAAASAAIRGLVTRNLKTGLIWLWYSLVIYVILALLITIVHILISYPFRNRLYYHLWLAKIVPLLQKTCKREKGRLIKLIARRCLGHPSANTLRIIKSFKESRVVDGYENSHSNVWKRSTVWKKVKRFPVFIRREDLIQKRFWPDWAFAVVMLFNQVEIEKSWIGNRQVFILNIDLCDQSYGIYNNAGKSFLKHEWGNTNDFKVRCRKQSGKIRDFFHDPNNPKLTINCEQMPLRWASGGFLPIVKWRGKKWIALFFRDLNPVGWNVANGASESKQEYKDLESLITREFGEELLVLDNRPPGDCRYVPFDFPDAEKNKLMEHFAKQHLNLRAFHDDLCIEKSSKRLTKVNTFDTPFRLNVKYHSHSFETLHKEIDNILFQVNPTEFGIEILKVCEFELPNDGYLLDGEIWTRSNIKILVRRPVMLFSIECMRRVFEENNGSIGSQTMDKAHLDCKLINSSIGRDDFYFFDEDISFKIKRLSSLRERTDKLRMFEVERLEDWFDRFGEQFQDAKSARELVPDKHHDLLSLCPVTWKAIEQILEHRIV